MRSVFLGVTVALFLMTIVSGDALSQSKNVYLQQSKLQKKVAWVVTGTVPLIIAAGWLSKEKPTNAYVTIPPRTTALIFGGLAAGMGSLLFVASAINKRKAASLSLESEPQGFLQMKMTISL